MSLLQMSVLGGSFILFVVIVRALAIHRIPKTTFLILWGVVVLRLLLPFSISSPFSIYTQVENFTSYVENMTEDDSLNVLEIVPLPNVDASQEAQGMFSSTFAIWLFGAMLLTTYFVVSYVKNHRKFRMSIPVSSPYIKTWLGRKHLKRTLDVRESDQIASPLTYGIIHPVILLPKKMPCKDEETLNYVLTHEYVHIRRFDAITKIVFVVALCVHWFNPLVWVMYVLANRDIELSCDECVVRISGEKEKSAYALALLDMEESKSGFSPLYNSFSKLAIQERIVSIMKYKKTSAIGIVAALIVVVGATTAFATSAAPNSMPPSLDYAIGNIENFVNRMEEESTHADADMDHTEHEAAVDKDDLEEVPLGLDTIISVSPDDESKFTAAEWDQILEMIEQGKVHWEN